MPSREIFWNIPYNFLLYIFAGISVVFLAYCIYRRVKVWRLGKPEDRTSNIGKRIGIFIRTTITDIFGHRRFLSEPYPGIMHFTLFWGFMILLLSAAIDAISHFTNHLLRGTPYLWFSLISDIAGFVLLIGVIMAIYRRYVMKPKRLNTFADDGVVLGVLAAVAVTGYMIEGLRMAATEIIQHPDWAGWSPGGLVFAKAFSGLDTNTILLLHRSFWWFHSVMVIGMICYIGLTFSKFQHIFVSPLNVFFRSFGPLGTPAPIDMDKAEILGVGDIKDFTWKQLLDLDACTNCGRCQDSCPAWATGKPLSPRKLVQDLKVHMLNATNKQEMPPDNLLTLVGKAPTEDEIWACTTCGACQESCPVYVEHIVKIIDLRRNLVLAQNKMPETAQLMLRNMQSRGNPWAGVQAMRLRSDWTNEVGLKVLGDGDQVDTLFWAGCTGALVERNVKATLSLARVLKTAGVDFGVLGDAETCCGDPARRAGYEFQFQMMAEQNLEVFKNHGIKQIITSCPHCFNTLKNEYPKYGGDFKVIHYTQLIADLIQQGKLKLTNKLNSKLTYHDPCYLGRYNGVYQQPRKILQNIPAVKIKEMGRSQNKSFCCGGGGGHMWIEEQPGTTKINQMRIEDVIKTGADTVVTACPYCLQMFEESIEHKDIQDKLKALDLIEIVEATMKQS